MWNAFRELESCRAIGMTIGAIPWTAVNHWARAHGVVGRERFEHLIRRMDDAYLVALHDDKKAKKEDLDV